MQMQKYTNVTIQNAPDQPATFLEVHRRMIISHVWDRRAQDVSVWLDTLVLLIALGTTFLWPPCLTARLLWMPPCCSLQVWLIRSRYHVIRECLCLFCVGNESCPQPQTSEHLAAIEIMKLKHIIILQNKIDLVKEGQAKEQHEQIVKFVQGTVAEGAPIIPISAQLKYNIEVIFWHWTGYFSYFS